MYYFLFNSATIPFFLMTRKSLLYWFKVGFGRKCWELYKLRLNSCEATFNRTLENLENQEKVKILFQVEGTFYL